MKLALVLGAIVVASGHAQGQERAVRFGQFTPQVAEAADTSCPVFPPVMSLELLDIYSDSHFSVVIPEAERKNLELTQGLDHFMHALEDALDMPDGRTETHARSCAYEAFRLWAAAGALTREPQPFNPQGTAKRAQYIVGLDILALKFKAVGYPIAGAVESWLRDLNFRNMNFYQRSSNRSNLRIWSGAAAALFAIIDRDATLLRYQDQVWREAIAAIRDDGWIAAELDRAHRALIYHMFSFSATLLLRGARRNLGYPETPADDRRLRLLGAQIGRALCEPRTLEVMARAPQEIPGDWAYRFAYGFGEDVLGPDWRRCGKPDAALSDTVFGGDTRVSAEALRELAH